MTLNYNKQDSFFIQGGHFFTSEVAVMKKGACEIGVGEVPVGDLRQKQEQIEK